MPDGNVSPLSPRLGSESDGTYSRASPAHTSESHLSEGRATLELQAGQHNPTWMSLLLLFFMCNKNERRYLTSWGLCQEIKLNSHSFLMTFDNVSRSGLMVQLPSSHPRMGFRPLGSHHQPLWSCLPRGRVTRVHRAGGSGGGRPTHTHTPGGEEDSGSPFMFRREGKQTRRETHGCPHRNQDPRSHHTSIHRGNSPRGAKCMQNRCSAKAPHGQRPQPRPQRPCGGGAGSAPHPAACAYPGPRCSSP